jgi:hypothetical protein
MVWQILVRLRRWPARSSRRLSLRFNGNMACRSEAQPRLSLRTAKTKVELLTRMHSTLAILEQESRDQILHRLLEVASSDRPTNWARSHPWHWWDSAEMFELVESELDWSRVLSAPANPGPSGRSYS